jgi:scaffold protein (connect acetoacetyl-CoA thiolase and HMG-CoA synthase)
MLKGTTVQALSSFAPPPSSAVGAEHFLTDGTRAVLRITRCRNCASSWFPARAQCSTCASWEVDEELTSSAGTAYASTVVRVGPPQFDPPYTLAYVDVDGVRLLAHATSADALVPGAPVDLVFAKIGNGDDGALMSYAVAASAPAGAR